VELTRVLEESFKVSVNTKYFNSVGELISAFPVPTLGGICKGKGEFVLVLLTEHGAMEVYWGEEV
jgi:hypothetical protein